MNYKKEYEEALERAKIAYKDEDKHLKAALERIFPELTKSEDEKIREELMDFIYVTCVPVKDLKKKERFLAWLEKQGEKKSVKWNELTWEDINDLEAIMNEVHSDFRNGIGQKSFGLEVLERFLYNKDCEDLDVKSPKFKDGDEIRSIDGQYEDTVLEVLSDGSYRLKNLGLLSIPENEWELVNAPVNGYELIDKKEQNAQKVLGQQLEKQGEHKGINDTDDDIVEAVKDTSILDMIEPKFKVGDWVVDDCAYVWKIEGILNQFYLLEGIEGGESRPTIEWVNKTFHLWNIEDAKDGDILATKAGGIFIYKELLYDKPFAYCGVDKFGVFKDCNCGNGLDWTPYLSNVTPATKEQRDLLFTKMHEAGYEWDAEKRELNGIDTYCKENCKGFQETGKCYCDGGCDAKIDAEKKELKKIESKFHEGEWIVSDYNNVAYVESISETKYNLQCKDGHHEKMSIEYIDRCWHLWTIQDAKEGDVLVSKDKLNILIFRNLDTSTSFSSYYNIAGKGELGWSNECFIPATKEQRDILFQKMKEAGYEWDEEKKKLSGIATIGTYCKENCKGYQETGRCFADGECDTKKNAETGWSEEDEKRVNRIADFIWKNRKGDTDEIYQQEQDVNWLKSLKDRYTWKPSEEQIKAFEHFVRSIGESSYASPYENNTKLLYSLLNDLKKLTK